MAKKDKEDDEFRPTGTIAVLTIFVVTLIAIWATIYMILVGRGGTLCARKICTSIPTNATG